MDGALQFAAFTAGNLNAINATAGGTGWWLHLIAPIANFPAAGWVGGSAREIFLTQLVSDRFIQLSECYPNADCVHSRRSHALFCELAFQ